VRTMYPSLSDNLQQVDDPRKTAVIDREPKRLNINIAALQIFLVINLEWDADETNG